MRDTVFLTAALALGCGGFTPKTPDASLEDGAADAAADATLSGPFRTCPQSADVMACYLLDGNGDDGSLNSNNGFPQGVTFEAGVVGDAANFVNNSRFVIDRDVATFNPNTALTAELWVSTEVAQEDAETDRVILVDVDGVFAVSLTDRNTVRCQGPGPIVESNPLPMGSGIWSHVACVFDTAVGWKLYLDGTERERDSAAAGLSFLTIDNGAELASDGPFQDDQGQFVGLLDNVVLWSVARTADELCSSAGDACLDE